MGAWPRWRRERTRFRELRRPGLTKSILTPVYCLLVIPVCRGASGDGGCTGAESRGLPVGARGRQCRAAAGLPRAAVRGEERGEPDLTVRPRGPEIRRRTSGATGSIGRGPADLVVCSGPGPVVEPLLRRWRRSRGDALSLASVGGPGLVGAGPGRRHNRPALNSSGTEEMEEAQSAQCTGRKAAM
ncbi:hypothetical protein NDU88_001451 [Pleurodeles waltl]|uniref:Uncharacterized protein n=1 Tax=Pleurodeles waltl TaxID=8319 RepID=A0AAV7LFY8_PLEWA|nr:hypothetical protein NDU88_001451 [Pleurodeles waltl]